MVETSGIVTQVSTGQGKRQYSGRETMLRVLGCAALCFLLAPFLLAFWIVGHLMSSGSQPSFVSRIAERVFGYWLGIEIWNRSAVTVCDLRVRESRTAQMRQVRIAGRLLAGNPSCGDWITVRGEDCYGTILLRDGVNHTIGSRIVVR